MKNSQQINSEKVTNENDKQTSKGRYLSPEEWQKNIDNLIFNTIVQSWNIKKVNKFVRQCIKSTKQI